MHRNKIIVVFTLMFMVALIAWATAAGAIADQRAVLAGRVVAEHLAAAGMTVHEGDVLAMVQSIAGPVPVARANTDGIVREVMVRPGDMVSSGDIIARVEAAHK